MVSGFVEKSNAPPTWMEMKHAVLRNFGWLDNVQPLEIFENNIQCLDKNAPVSYSKVSVGFMWYHAGMK